MLKTIWKFLALQRHTTSLLLMVILVGRGERIGQRFLPLYLLALGGGVASVGIFAASSNGLNALYSFFGGYISDRLGQARALLLFNTTTIAGYLIVVVFPYWQAVIIGSFFFLTWSAVSMPATLDLISRSVPPSKRAMGVSMTSLVRRVPMMLGPLIGGALIEQYGEQEGIRYAFMIAIVTALVSIVIQRIMIGSSGSPAARPNPNPLALWKEMSGSLKRLLLSDILVRFCEQIPYAFVVVWCVDIIAVSPVQFGVLTTVEMVTALLIYIPVAHFADKTEKKPFVVATFGFFSVFPLMLMFSKSFSLLIAAFVIRGLKEFGEPTRKALILEFSPDDKKAGMFGFYYLLRDSVVAVAAFAGAWLWEIGPSVNLLTAFGFGVLGTLWFALKGKNAGAPPA
jgi:MFS family permease